jgi:hypothetical protein
MRRKTVRRKNRAPKDLAPLPTGAVRARALRPLESLDKLFEVRSYHVDQLFGGAARFGLGLQCGINQMHADMIFDHFAHQTVDCTPGSGDELQDVGTADFLVKRPLDSLDLPANAPHAVQELGLLSDSVGHEGNSI